MNPYSVELWIVALIVLVVLLGGFGTFSRWCLFSPAVKQARINALRVGMTLDEVTALLGEPRDCKRTDSGAQIRLYGFRMKRHVLYLEFNHEGRLERFVHGVPDLRRPGQMLERE